METMDDLMTNLYECLDNDVYFMLWFVSKVTEKNVEKNRTTQNKPTFKSGYPFSSCISLEITIINTHTL